MAQNKVLSSKAISAAICVMVLFVSACDYGRSGRYKVTVWSPSSKVSTLTVTNSDQQQIIALLQVALRERKFSELRAGYWTANCVNVSWDASPSGEVKLCVGSFGPKKAVFESERIELDIIRRLLTQPNIRVIPDTSPIKAPIE